MDSFCEQIVQKKKGAKEWIIIVAVTLGALVLGVLSWAFLGSLFFVAAVGIIYASWKWITAQNIEYEYCVTDADMSVSIDVDQITARRKRKRLVSVSGRKIEHLLPFDPTAPMGKYQRLVMVAPSLLEEGLWYFTYHSKKNGSTFVVFQPNERVLRQLYAGLPKLVQMDTDRAARGMGMDRSARHSHGE